MFSLVSQSSLHHLRGLGLLLRCFVRLTSLVLRRESDSSSRVHAGIAALAFSGPACPLIAAASDEVSRFSCMLFLSVHGVCDYAGPLSNSRFRPSACGLPLLSTGSASRVAFSKLNTQPADTSVYASAHTSRWRAARLEVRWFATPFL